MSANGLVLPVVAILGALVVVAVGTAVRNMFMATKGKRIPAYKDPRKALVVLDIQEGYNGTNPRQPATVPATTGLIGTVNRLIDAVAEGEMEVAYIRQVFSNNFFVRLHGGRRVGRVVIDRRVRIINDNDFEKNRTDAFSSGAFEKFLIDRSVDKLYLVGVDAAFCVYYTALGGLNRGYKVQVVTDAVRSRYTMSTVLDRYKRKGIPVTTSDQLIAQAKPLSQA